MPEHDGRSISARAAAGVNVDAQDGLFDKVIEDGDLIAALERREEAAVEKRDAVADFKVADDAVKDKLLGYHLEVGEVARVGRFKIKKTRTDGGEVSFERNPSDRTTISLLDG